MDSGWVTTRNYRVFGLVLLFFLYAIVGTFGEQRDFHFFSCAAPIYFAGKDIYQSQEYLTCVFPEGLPADVQAYVFPYPPQIFALIAPFFIAPPELERPVFIVTAALAGTAAFSFLASTFQVHRGVRYSRVALFVAASSVPILSTYAMGQLSAFSLLIISMFMRVGASSVPGKDFIQGLCLGVFIAKPQVVWLLVLGWVIVTPAARRWSLVGGIAASALLLTAIAALISQNSLAQFCGKSFGSLLSFSSPTVPSQLSAVLPISRIALSLLCGLCALALTLKSYFGRAPTPALASILVAASVLTSPYLWSYDFYLLLPLTLAIISPLGDSISFGVRWKVLVASNLLMFLDYLTVLSQGSRKPDGFDLWYAVVIVVLFVLSTHKSLSGRVARTC